MQKKTIVNTHLCMVGYINAYLYICTHKCKIQFGNINPKLLIMVTWDRSGPGVKERRQEVKGDFQFLLFILMYCLNFYN